MTTPLSLAINGRDDAERLLQERLDEAIRWFGYTEADLLRAGLSRRSAKAAAEVYGPVQPVETTNFVEVPLAVQADGIVATVASSGKAGKVGAWDTIDPHRIYLRAEGLDLPVWPEATHIASDRDGVIRFIFPIQAHIRVGDLRQSKLPKSHPMRSRLIALVNDRVVSDTWDACHIYFLGSPISVSVHLPPRSGLAGTRHYRLSALAAATHLSTVRTINQGG